MRNTSFAVIGVDRYELGVVPLGFGRSRIFEKGSAHPALSEAERTICLASA